MTEDDTETIATLRRVTSDAIDRLREIGISLRERDERIAFLEKENATLKDRANNHTNTVWTRETSPAATSLPADILAAPIPDEQWKPRIAVDMTKDAPAPTGSLEDDLLRQVYRQNRVTPEKPVEGG